MLNQTNDKLPHLLITETAKSQQYKSPIVGGGDKPVVPRLDRLSHGQHLQGQLRELGSIAKRVTEAQVAMSLNSGLGLQIQFVGIPNVPLAFESLASERGKNIEQHIEILSVCKSGDLTIANVYVPDGKLAHFERYVVEYLEEKKNKRGVSLDHSSLLNAIASIRVAELQALWTDDIELLPKDTTEKFWWEVWLPVRGRRNDVVADFRKLATLAECQVSEHQINFPERTVALMHGSQDQFTSSVMTLNCVAELRKAKETATFFDAMTPPEQLEWAEEAFTRITHPSDVDSTPRICLLDSGVNIGHPLLAKLASHDDLHTVNPAWGADDNANHGTGLAGLACYGDLTDFLASTGSIEISHRLESVKLTPELGANQGDSRLHGFLFSQAVNRPEITSPNRPRVFTSAVTSSDDRDRGQPSAWSAMTDSLAAGYDNGGMTQRLFVLSAGNTDSEMAWSKYPDSLTTNGIRDPGQAWNALTVGAFTNKVNVTEEDAQHYVPVASSGGLSPYTSTSGTWMSAWPLKPDVVFEGGNVGKSPTGCAGVSSLHLLTTNNNHLDRLFTTTNATSAASALCAQMTAQIMAAYPALRPETIRGLITHSAEWTDGMRSLYLPKADKSTKADYVNLIRHCGWGVPDVGRAIWSAGNSLTLIAEDEVRPYKKVKGQGVVSRDMNLHALPWPKNELLALPPDTPVELRITLSYFIEPNPSARGVNSKYAYPSHRLRFDVQRPLDATTEDFVTRINAAAAREEDEDPIDTNDPDWILGALQRHRGSLHQDIWHGSAAQLAQRGHIAIYPSKGWWRTRQAQGRYDSLARYSLIVSIRTPVTDVDLYTPVAQQIAVPLVAMVEINT